jgi:hypothetical protein
MLYLHHHYHQLQQGLFQMLRHQWHLRLHHHRQMLRQLHLLHRYYPVMEKCLVYYQFLHFLLEMGLLKAIQHHHQTHHFYRLIVEMSQSHLRHHQL